jgi:hypothetical protein
MAIKNIRWAEISSASRNCLTALGAIAAGAWFWNQSQWWAIAAGAAVVALTWWVCYRLAVAFAARRQHRFDRERPRARYERIRRPGKRAVASWANFVDDVRFEKAAQRAGW